MTNILNLLSLPFFFPSITSYIVFANEDYETNLGWALSLEAKAEWEYEKININLTLGFITMTFPTPFANLTSYYLTMRLAAGTESFRLFIGYSPLLVAYYNSQEVGENQFSVYKYVNDYVEVGWELVYYPTQRMYISLKFFISLNSITNATNYGIILLPKTYIGGLGISMGYRL